MNLGWAPLREHLAALQARFRGLPPPALQDAIGGRRNFVQIGEAYAGFLERFTAMQPDSHVLDIGCGVGRVARPLTRRLRPPGRYEGFDVWPAGIQWCQRHLTRRFPHFRFQCVDVRNTTYNPGGRLDPATFAFAYADAAFDVALAVSVFTHLQEATAQHYLTELRRVLRPGARALLTWLLVDAIARTGIEAGRSVPAPRHPLTASTWTGHPDQPERAIGYAPAWVEQAVQRAGLEIEAIHWGSWSGARPRLTHGHDIVILRRPT